MFRPCFFSGSQEMAAENGVDLEALRIKEFADDEAVPTLKGLSSDGFFA